VSGRRLLIANLACEYEWLHLAGRDPALADLGVPAQVPAHLPKAVLERLAAMGTLLRVHAQPEDTLWLPETPPIARMVPVPGFPPVQWRMTGGAPFEEIVGWGQTPLVEGMQQATDGSGARVAARVNHRDFCASLGTAEADGVRLMSVVAVDKLVARAGPGHLVAKSPFGMSGRGQLHIDPSTWRADERGHARLARMLGQQGSVRVERWHRRIQDFGDVGTTADPSSRRSHRALVDARGRFLGIWLTWQGDEPAPAPGRTAAGEIAAASAFQQAREGLLEAGYEGPLGVDSYSLLDGSQDGEGQPAVVHRPLCEINARYSFGHVAHALAARLLPILDATPPLEVVLWMGPHMPRRDGVSREVVLVSPDDHGREGISLFITPRGRPPVELPDLRS
jgi:hypothetical protein